ncbi:hypothetical protein [Roseinatronobacter sp.]
MIVQQRCGDASGQTDEGAHRKVNVLDHHDAHLRNRRQRNGHGQIEQQIYPEIAHGAGLHVEGCHQQQRQ